MPRAILAFIMCVVRRALGMHVNIKTNLSARLSKFILLQDMITSSSKWLHLHVGINNLAFTELIIKINLSG